MEHQHPIRKYEVCVYERIEGGTGPSFYAYFGNGNDFPIRFAGKTADEARDRAEAFRADTIRQHEETYSARKAALEKARATRKAKEAEEA